MPDSLEVQYNIARHRRSPGQVRRRHPDSNQLLQKTEHADGEYSLPDKNNRAVFLERLGTVYREANKHQQAVDTFRKMLDLGRRKRHSRLSADHRDLPRQQAVAAGHPGGGTKRRRSFPTTATCRWFRPRNRPTWANPTPAIAHVKALLKGNADDREVYIALAQMYSRVKDWTEAEETINKAIDLSTKPEDKDYAHLRARAPSTSARRNTTWRKRHSTRCWPTIPRTR